MKVKVQCPCEARYEFEVEPVHGRMPVPVTCPSCGQDGTALANASIQQQLSAAPVPEAKPRVRIVAAAPVAMPIAPAVPSAPAPPSVPASPPLAPPISAGGGLRVAKHASASTASAAQGAPVDAKKFCYKHHVEPAAETCRACGKPICLKCMEMFGYVCSVYCREQAERRGIEVPAYANQKIVVQRKSSAKATRVVMAIAAGVVALIGVWIWYAFFGSMPRVVYSYQIPKAERGTFYHLLAPNELLSMNGKQLTLLDVTKQKAIWQTPFDPKAPDASTPMGALTQQLKAVKAAKTNSPPAAQKTNAPAVASAAATGESDDDEDLFDYPYFGKPRVITNGDDLWLLFSHQIARFDRRTGARKDDVELDEPIESINPTDAGILVVSRGERGKGKIVTRVALPAGTVEKEKIDVPVPPDAFGKNPWLGQTKTANATPIASSNDENEDGIHSWERSGDEFIVANPTVVQFKFKMLEKIITEREAMKPKTGPSLMESGKLTAGRGLDAIQEMMNDSQRQATGGKVRENVSRYQVTLRRWLSKSAQDWTGEVVGPPGFYPAKTVDVLAGSQTMYVFDKNNVKRWEAKLTYPMGHGYSFYSDELRSPCVETSDALYVFDQGMLTRFDLNTGQAKWRLTSVGISKVQPDGQGHLYVTSTTQSPDDLRYSQQVNIYQHVQSVMLKVDAASGKVLWNQPRIYGDFMLTGKYVYATLHTASGMFNSLSPGESTHFNLYRINPSNGKEMWKYYQGRYPSQLDVQQNWIMLHFGKEVQVLKYLSL